MSKKIYSKGIKELLKNRHVLMSIAVFAAVAIILTVVFFTRYVLDCVSVENAVNVVNKNDVTYKVKVKDEFKSLYGKENLGEGITYLYPHTESIMIDNVCNASLSKGVNGLDCRYEITGKIFIRQRSGGNLIAEYRVDAKIPPPEVSAPSAGTDFASAALNKQAPYIVNLENARKEFEDFQKTAKEALTGHLVIEFKFRVFDGGVINSETVRGVAIPLTGEAYKIDFTGNPVSDRNFPERSVRFPNLFVTAVITAVTAALVAVLVLSVKELYAEKDAYKKAVKVIFKRYGDEIVMAESGAAMQDCPVTDVKSFRELTKFSQSLNKPVVCFASEELTTFCIYSDGMLYRFNVDAAKEREKAAQESKAENKNV